MKDETINSFQLKNLTADNISEQIALGSNFS